MKKERYKCNKCGQVVKRDPMVGGDGTIRKTPRVWMNSYCREFENIARLYRIKKMKHKLST